MGTSIKLKRSYLRKVNYMNKDKSFCASPQCKNECGRKMKDELREILAMQNMPWVSYGYFCVEPEYTRVVNTFSQCVDNKGNFKHE